MDQTGTIRSSLFRHHHDDFPLRARLADSSPWDLRTEEYSALCRSLGSSPSLFVSGLRRQQNDSVERLYHHLWAENDVLVHTERHSFQGLSYESRIGQGIEKVSA